MLTPAEIYYIEAHFHHDTPISHIAKRIGRARQTVHNVIAYLRDGHTALDYYQAIMKTKNAGQTPVKSHHHPETRRPDGAGYRGCHQYMVSKDAQKPIQIDHFRLW